MSEVVDIIEHLHRHVYRHISRMRSSL